MKISMNIFITGNPRCGKSTLIQKIRNEISDQKVSGFITPEINVQNRRKGFKIIDLTSKKEEVMASVDIKSGPKVSKYKVNVKGIDKVIEKFLQSYESSKYVVIDEIGKMEFYSKKFRETIKMVLDSDKTVLATLSKQFVNQYRDKGKIYFLKRENFDQIYEQVLNQLRASG